jgi:hypothetical protein
MKNILNYSYILFSIICLYSCSQGSSSINDDSKKIDLDNRNYLLTKKELSGTYKGNKTDQKFDLNTAVKITIYEDGTYISNYYINGEELTKDGYSPQKGTYEIRMQKEEIKNPYGEVTGVKYNHGIDFNENSKYGLRTSTYLITGNFKFEPFALHNWIDPEIILEKTQ